MVEKDLKLGSTVWIERTATGDVTYRVKLIFERKPSEREYCKQCATGKLNTMGHIMQHGILDDKIYAVMNCEKCCAVTVFIYHVDSGEYLLPEDVDCGNA